MYNPATNCIYALEQRRDGQTVHKFPSTQMLVEFGSQRVGPTCMVGPTRPLPIRIAKIKTNVCNVRENHKLFGHFPKA